MNVQIEYETGYEELPEKVIVSGLVVLENTSFDAHAYGDPLTQHQTHYDIQILSITDEKGHDLKRLIKAEFPNEWTMIESELMSACAIDID